MPMATRCILLLSLAWLCIPAAAAELAIVDARIYPAPDAPAIERGTVLVRDGRIAAVGPSASVEVPDGATVIDADGQVLTAGFWNSHVHLLAPPMLQADTRPAEELADALEEMFTRWGFTTVFDLASLPDNTAALRRRVASGEVAGPLILSVGAPFFPKDGTPAYARELLARAGAPSFEAATAPQARTRAQAQLAGGADGVKLFIGAIMQDGVRHMDGAVAAAVAEAAHAAGEPVFAHPTDRAGLQLAIDAGVDVLAHTAPAGGPWSPELAERLVAADIALIPSLMLFEIELTKEHAPGEVTGRVLDTAGQQARALAEAGGMLLFGTDTGYIDVYDPGREYGLLAEAGFDWRQVLASLTTTPAQRFGHGARKGRVAAGMDADLVLLGSDPASDPEAFADVRRTIRAGRVIHDASAD
jgi:imidazolonepropionase-like amidohydrolase